MGGENIKREKRVRYSISVPVCFPMVSLVWLLWEVASGALALSIWLVPKGIDKWVQSDSTFLLWWNFNGGWIGLGVFGFVTVFVAPFRAWDKEYRKNIAEKKQHERERTQ